MSRHGKIDWKRLRYAAKETALIMLCGVIMIAFLTVPWVFIFLTGSRWWILLYPVAFFVIETWENYNGN